MARIDVRIPTSDGVSAGTLHVPDGPGIWPGHHGFAVPDQPVYDEALSERHWAALQTLYAAQLA